jgi:DNA polymerase-3 subunit gamma/tau
MSEVLALKYRPSSFEKLIGQNSIRQTLTGALDQNRLSHVYLFSGLRGSGKTSTARIFAKSLICDIGPTSTPCESCQNCLDAKDNSHIDIIEMDGASSRKIDDIRSLIEQTKYKPNSARFKVFIIDEVHMLTREAFNALLKTLEEPPEFIKFILATTDPMKLPTTILSRTQHFRFKKISNSDVIKHISHILNLENIKYEDEALKIITRAGNGSLRDTLTILDQAIIFTKGFIEAKSVASMLGVLDPEFFEKLMDTIIKSDKDSLLNFLQEIDEYEADIVLDEFISYIKDKFFTKDHRFSLILIERYFRILSQSKSLLTQGGDSSFILSLTFFKMIEANKLKEINSMIETLELKNTKGIEQTDIKTPSKPLKEDGSKDSFSKLLEALYDRNYELGECFETYIELIKYQDSTLYLRSNAPENCKEVLRKSSSIIKHFVKDIFSINSKISIEQGPIQEEDIKKKDITNSKESSSSCVETLITPNTKEIDPDDIMQNPFVQKAKDLFEPKKIVIKSKV